MEINKALKLEQLQYVKQYSEKNFVDKSKIGDGLIIDKDGQLKSNLEFATDADVKAIFNLE